MENNSDSPDRQTLFDEVLLYVLDKTNGKRDIGQNVVLKLFEWVDKDWAAGHGERILRPGRRSYCFGHASNVFTDTVRRLIADGAITRERALVGTSIIQRLVALREPNLALVPAEVTAVVDGVLKRIEGKYGAEILGREPPGSHLPPEPKNPPLYGSAVRREAYRVRHHPGV
jgi:hypothetical protein